MSANVTQIQTGSGWTLLFLTDPGPTVHTFDPDFSQITPTTWDFPGRPDWFANPIATGLPLAHIPHWSYP